MALNIKILYLLVLTFKIEIFIQVYNYDIIYKNMFIEQNILNHLILVFKGILQIICISIWLPDFLRWGRTQTKVSDIIKST